MQDTITLDGDYESRVEQLLRLAQRSAKLAQQMARPRMQEALSALEDAVSDHLASLANAADDDMADAEEMGDTERERQAWRPLRAA